MKTHAHYLLILAVLLLAQCNNDSHDKLIGIWKLKQIEINGATLNSEALGNPLWEFNKAGGYLINVAGEKEKGKYKVDNNTITLTSVTNPQKQPLTYTFSYPDTLQLRMESNAKNNAVKITFDRVAEGEEMERD